MKSGEIFSEIKKLVSEGDSYYKELRKKHSLVEKLKLDIEHEIELDRLSASAMMKKYKEYKNLLETRRIIKDEIDFMSKIREYSFTGDDINKLKQSIETIGNNKKNRVYTKKVEINERKSLGV